MILMLLMMMMKLKQCFFPNLGQFFSEKSLVQVKIILFRLKIGENSPQQDHCESHESLGEE
jgi:hypothetical protein